LLHVQSKLKAGGEVLQVVAAEGAEVLHNGVKLKVLHASLAECLLHCTVEVTVLSGLLPSFLRFRQLHMESCDKSGQMSCEQVSC
jgi:hypothetical protein